MKSLLIFSCLLLILFAQPVSAQEAPQCSVECLIATEAHKFGIDPKIALYISYQESHFHPEAKGDYATSTMSYTSFGLFQLHNPQRFGLTIAEALDPLTNIETAMKIMIQDGSLRQWSTCKMLNVPALCGT